MRFGLAMLRRAAVVLTLVAGLLAVPRPTAAQQPTGHFVVAVCGTVPVAFVAGRTTAPGVVDVNGNTCIAGVVTATLAFPTIGAAVPTTGVYSAINVGGLLTGMTGGTTAADNVTAPVGGLDTRSFNYVWDGAAWDRLYGDSTNGAFVNVKATVTALGVTPTDRTITSATGASQTAMAANAARKSLTIQNTGTANCGVNPTGGTAVIGGAGTITLFPGGAYSPRVPTLAAVTVICTAGQPLYANES